MPQNYISRQHTFIDGVEPAKVCRDNERLGKELSV